jgi:3-hydroxyacyl-[acyl-carrier-protein] dehydratase
MLLQDFYTLKNIQKNDDTNYDAFVSLNKNHPIFQGHFPGNPITPGVCMLQIFKNLSTQIMQTELEMEVSKNIKFLAIINPETNPDLRLNVQIATTSNTSVQVNFAAFMDDVLALKISAQYKKAGLKTCDN